MGFCTDFTGDASNNIECCLIGIKIELMAVFFSLALEPLPMPINSGLQQINFFYIFISKLPGQGGLFPHGCSSLRGPAQGAPPKSWGGLVHDLERS